MAGDDDRLIEQLTATIQQAVNCSDGTVSVAVDAHRIELEAEGDAVRLSGDAVPVPRELQVSVDRVLPFGDAAVLVVARLDLAGQQDASATTGAGSRTLRSIFICERHGDSWQIVAVLKAPDAPVPDQ